MIPRRQLFGIPIAGGLLHLASPAEADAAPAAGQQQVDSRAMESIARAINELGNQLAIARSFNDIEPVRNAQRQHLQITSKLPDFIDVGSEVWFRLHDWHIRWQQPLVLGRDAAGRYTLVFMQTLVILRLDQQSGYIGVPYDARA